MEERSAYAHKLLIIKIQPQVTTTGCNGVVRLSRVHLPISGPVGVPATDDGSPKPPAVSSTGSTIFGDYSSGKIFFTIGSPPVFGLRPPNSGPAAHPLAGPSVRGSPSTFLLALLWWPVESSSGVEIPVRCGSNTFIWCVLRRGDKSGEGLWGRVEEGGRSCGGGCRKGLKISGRVRISAS